MQTRRLATRTYVLALVIVAVGLASLAGVAGALPLAVDEPTTDNTVTTIDVHADGSARWTVRIRTRLQTEDSVTRYEAFQDRFRANRSQYLDGFRGPIESIVAEAAATTGREMAVRNVSAETSIRTVPRRWGIVEYAFTWEGFARAEGDRLHVGDAFESGFFIATNDTLHLSAPGAYELSSVEPSPDERENGTAIWHGRVDFGPGNPRATISPVPAQSGTGLAIPIVVGIILLVLIGAAVIGYRRVTAADEAPTSGAQPVGGSAPAASPPLTDTDRLRRLLSEHDGQMRQAAIVEEVDWSKSKVSRLLDDLVESGVVEKTRLGRENVVSLLEDRETERED
jgi:uncharacterized membrane protein